MKFHFKMDLEKDFLNYFESANIKSSYGESQEFWSRGISPSLKKLLEDKGIKEAESNALPIISKCYDSYHIYFEVFLKQVEEFWNIAGTRFIERFEGITQKKFPFDELTVYLTTISRCPYNFKEKWIMVSFLNSPLMCAKTIAHELMHFHFYFYHFEIAAEELGDKKAEDLKEALTVLLNLEFRDLLFFIESGFSGHKDLRDIITISWKQEKDYEKLIQKCISFLKNGY